MIRFIGIASMLVFLAAFVAFTWWFVSHFVKVMALIVPATKDNRRRFDRKVDRYTRVEHARKARRPASPYAVSRDSVKREPELTSMDPDDDPLIREDEDD